MTFFENFWNCPNCGQTHISALRKLKCPQCGHSKVSSSDEYMGNEITDEDGLELARGGPHWNCRFCYSVNLDKYEKCQDCGRNPDDKDEPMPTIDYGTNPPREKPKTNDTSSVTSTFPPLGERVPDEHQDAAEYVNLAQPYYEKPKNRRWFIPFDFKSLDWTKIGIGLTAIGIIFAIWFFVFRTTPRNGTVSGFSWTRDVVIDRYQTVSENGWSVPYGGRLTGTTSRIYDYTEIYSTRRVQKTCYRNRGNGSSESYDCSTSERYLVSRTPNYKPYYYYDIDRFIYNRTMRATEDNRSPYWPSYTLAYKGTLQIGAERVSRTSELYTVKFTVYNQKEEKKEYALDTDQDAWSKYSTEETYILKINSLGKILNDPYRDKLKADLKKTTEANK